MMHSKPLAIFVFWVSTMPKNIFTLGNLNSMHLLDLMIIISCVLESESRQVGLVIVPGKHIKKILIRN